MRGCVCECVRACVSLCVCACVRAYVRACVCVCRRALVVLIFIMLDIPRLVACFSLSPSLLIFLLLSSLIVLAIITKPVVAYLSSLFRHRGRHIVVVIVIIISLFSFT